MSSSRSRCLALVREGVAGVRSGVGQEDRRFWPHSPVDDVDQLGSCSCHDRLTGVQRDLLGRLVQERAATVVVISSLPMRSRMALEVDLAMVDAMRSSVTNGDPVLVGLVLALGERTLAGQVVRPSTMSCDGTMIGPLAGDRHLLVLIMSPGASIWSSIDSGTCPPSDRRRSRRDARAHQR